jgi:hypothetical protein
MEAARGSKSGSGGRFWPGGADFRGPGFEGPQKIFNFSVLAHRLETESETRRFGFYATFFVGQPRVASNMMRGMGHNSAEPNRGPNSASQAGLSPPSRPRVAEFSPPPPPSDAVELETRIGVRSHEGAPSEGARATTESDPRANKWVMDLVLFCRSVGRSVGKNRLRILPPNFCLAFLGGRECVIFFGKREMSLRDRERST